MTRRYALRDDQWERLAGLLPGREGAVGVTAKDNRLFVEAVLYRYRAGISWRDLPDRFGNWKAVHTRFSRWAASGVWERVFKILATDADNDICYDRQYNCARASAQRRSPKNNDGKHENQCDSRCVGQSDEFLFDARPSV